MRLALVTDAWLPQVNGVTTTLDRCRRELEQRGHQVTVLSPNRFRTVPCPRYPQIRLALRPGRRLGRLLEEVCPQAIHIATEGPLGLAARRLCRKRALPFTTSLHTRFPDYLRTYAGIPTSLTWRLMRAFHNAARWTLVPTESLRRELEARGFERPVTWSRGVDANLFRPGLEPVFDLPRPVLLYVGRVAEEKGLGDFLSLSLPGSRVVVGDGPTRARLESAHPDVHWCGFRFGDELARHYADADVLVFPSRTDTFGVVMLEAAACGVPVAAYPVPGPADVVVDGVTGALDLDLRRACLRALTVHRTACRAHALQHTWSRCADLLEERLQVFGWS